MAQDIIASKFSEQQPKVVQTFDRLPKDALDKFKEVDSIPVSGIKAFSARIIEKTPYQQSSLDRSGVTTCYNLLVEIVKKPGQTLGLYLREGNGDDRLEGVFVSRIAENGQMIKSDILKKGDEILTVNHVDISRMCLDDVVIMMSIPKRLLLQVIRKEHKEKLKPALKISPLSPNLSFTVRRQKINSTTKSLESNEIARNSLEEQLKKQQSLPDAYYTSIEPKYLRNSPKRLVGGIRENSFRISAPVIIEQENFKVQEYYPNSYPSNNVVRHELLPEPDLSRRHLWKYNNSNVLTKSNSLPRHQANNLSVISRMDNLTRSSVDHELSRILRNHENASSAPELRTDHPIYPYQFQRQFEWNYCVDPYPANPPFEDYGIKHLPRPLYRCNSNPYYPMQLSASPSKCSTMQIYPGSVTSDKISSEVKNLMVSPSLTGLLILHVIEGRGFESRDGGVDEEMYCVVQIDGDHRARTEVSSRSLGFRWNETFEIDVWECKRADFYIYSWHPLHRRTLRHRGRLRLPEALITGQLKNHEQCFALCLEPGGQLLIRVGFHSLLFAFRRPVSNRRNVYWGVPLSALLFRENGLDSPILLKRMLGEVEQRGIDLPGLYLMCASLDKKMSLRHELELRPSAAELDSDVVPDLNMITTLIKDFLRELPEPLVPAPTYQLLVDAWRILSPNNKDGNAKLLLGVLDCLPVEHKSTFILVMDHLKYVISHSLHNGLSSEKLSRIFGPVIFCGCRPTEVQTKRVPINYLDHRLAGFVFEVLIDLWPFRLSKKQFRCLFIVLKASTLLAFFN